MKAGVTVLMGARLRLQDGPPDWRFELVQRAESLFVHCKFVIDASGRNAWLVRALGHNRSRIGGNVAGIQYLKETGAQSGKDNRILVEQIEDGWWYTIPLVNHRIAVGLVTTAKRWSDFREKPEICLGNWLDQAAMTRSRVSLTPGCFPAFKRAAFPQLSTRVCGAGWLAIGDAACALDPLSGQGILKGLIDSARAFELVNHTLSSGKFDPEKYEADIRAYFRKHCKERDTIYGQTNRTARNYMEYTIENQILPFNQ